MSDDWGDEFKNFWLKRFREWTPAHLVFAVCLSGFLSLLVGSATDMHAILMVLLVPCTFGLVASVMTLAPGKCPQKDPGLAAPSALREVDLARVHGDPNGNVETLYVTCTGTGAEARLDSWTLESPAGTPIDLSGATVNYDLLTKTVQIDDLPVDLVNGDSFLIQGAVGFEPHDVDGLLFRRTIGERQVHRSQADRADFDSGLS